MESGQKHSNYQQIIEHSLKTNAQGRKLLSERNQTEEKKWKAVSASYESMARFDTAETNNYKLKVMTTESSKRRDKLDREHARLDGKLQDLQGQFIEIEKKNKDTRKDFLAKLDQLYNGFKQLPHRYDNTQMHQTIGSAYRAAAQCEKDVMLAESELNRVKVRIEGSSMDNDLSNLQADAIRLIQKGSLEEFGEPLELQRRLTETRQYNENLKKNIQDVKVKYGIFLD